MAEDFDVWLEKHLYGKLSDQQTNSPVLTVAVTGKEVADNTKADLLNNYLGKNVFMDRWISSEEQSDVDEAASHLISIDVFYDSDASIVWMLLNGANDLAVQHFFFDTNLNSNNAGRSSFFEKMASVERQQLKALAVLFQLCHAILIVDQGCRFDLDWIGCLKQLNRLRPRICKRIRHALSIVPESELNLKYSRTLIESGRNAIPPRLLFCFYRNPLRNDLNQTKKKELLEKMEKCLENQIASLFKQHGLLDNRFPENALCEITITSGTPFVYCFQHNENPVDVNHELTMTLFGGSITAQNIVDESLESSLKGRDPMHMNVEEIKQIITDNVKLKREDKETSDSFDYNFDYFLNKALSKLRQKTGSNKKSKEKTASMIELTTLNQFVESAKLVKQCIIEELDKENGILKLMPELETIENLVDSTLWSAQAVYTRQLQLQPEITGGGNPVFSFLEHQYTLNMALDYLNRSCPRATCAQRREQMIEQLRNRCHDTWLNRHQRCEQRSLTGQLCHFMINHDESPSTSRDRSRSTAYDGQRLEQKKQSLTRKTHCSGVKTFSMCNCGMSRQIRIDPFTLKEANYNFYVDTTLSNENFRFAACCSQLDKYDFKLFDPTFSVTTTIANEQSPTTKTVAPVFTQLSDLSAAKTGKNLKEKKSTNIEYEIEEEEAVRLAMVDPSEFNVRFFDDNSNNENEENHHIENEQHELPHHTLNSPELHAWEEGYEEQKQQSVVASQDEDGEEDEEDEEEKPRAHRKRKQRNLLPEESNDDDEDDDDEKEKDQTEDESQQNLDADITEENTTAKTNRCNSSSPKSGQWLSSCSSPEPQQHYLDEYDSHLFNNTTKNEIYKNDLKSQREWLKDPKFIAKYKGLYLEHVPHTSTSSTLLPLFPSFSVVCLGHSAVYNHSTGIRGVEGRARFRNGSEFLMPWSVNLMVNTEHWVRELQYIGVIPSERTMRNLQNSTLRNRTESKEKVKLFIGFDYECPRGHRFMLGDNEKPLKHRRSSGLLKQDAAPLLETDLPIWMPCACRKEPRTTAQLMRIHVVTPKAPVSVSLQPMIQMPDDDTGFFYPGAMERIELGWAKYYICRLPYAYVGPNGPTYKPNILEYKGHLMRQCVKIAHLPMAESTYA